MRKLFPIGGLLFLLAAGRAHAYTLPLGKVGEPEDAKKPSKGGLTALYGNKRKPKMAAGRVRPGNGRPQQHPSVIQLGKPPEAH